MKAKDARVVLQEWTEAKRQHALTDTQVQMARELGMKPRHLLQPESEWEQPLGRRIEDLYLKRFRKALPDSVVPLRQALYEARTRERAEARERRRRKREAEKEHAEAARISLLTLQRLCYGRGLRYAMGTFDDLTESEDDRTPTGGR